MSRQVLPFDKAQEKIDTAASLGLDFTVRQSGSTCVVKFISSGEGVKSGRSFRYSDTARGHGGTHLSRLAWIEVEKRVASGEYVPVNKDNDRITVNTVCFDPENIRRNIDGDAVAIDIRGCYWDTLYNIGAISERVWAMGHRKDREWKDARAIAVGSLGAEVKAWSYCGGQLVGDGTVHYRRKFNVVRLDVIDRVWQVFLSIIEKVQPGFMMFLTDCFFVTAEYKEKVEALLNEAGYKYVSKRCKFYNLYLRGGLAGSRVYDVTWSVEDKPDKKVHSFNERHLWSRAVLSGGNLSEVPFVASAAKSKPRGNTVILDSVCRQESSMTDIEILHNNSRNIIESMGIRELLVTYDGPFVKRGYEVRKFAGFTNVCRGSSVDPVTVALFAECPFNKIMQAIDPEVGAKYLFVLARPVKGEFMGTVSMEFPIRVTCLDTSEVWEYSYKKKAMEKVFSKI